MRIRADIAELLRAGTPQAHICRQLRCAPVTVQRTREALGLPAPKTCRPLPATLDEAFRQHAQPTEDGHVTWTGSVVEGGPRVKFEGKAYYARRLAFRFHHGREPVGKITVACGRAVCVAGRCMEDRPMREKAAELYAAVFGAPS